jgi:hypothetical protein
MHIGYWWECQKDRDSYTGEGMGGWIISRLILEIQDVGSLEWIDLVQNWGQWRDPVNMVMNLWFHKMLGSS